MSLTMRLLSNPRLDDIASMTFAPLPNVTSENRSLLASKDCTNVLAASLTAGQRPPIELETSSTRLRSTILRVASPELVTVTSLKFARLMNVVGSFAVAETVTTLTPVA